MGQQGPAPVLVYPSILCVFNSRLVTYHGSEFIFQVLEDSRTKGSKWYQMVQVSQFGDYIVIGKMKEEEGQVPSEYSSKALL
jgi:hypothetical protein